MAAQENGSEQQWEFGKDVFSHPSSSIFNIFLERIMSDALDDGKISTGSRITNLEFADE